MADELSDALAAAGVPEGVDLDAVRAALSAPGVVGALPQSDPYQGRDLVADGAAAVAQAQREARDEVLSFAHGGETFRFCDVMDVRVVIALNRGNVARALELALVDGAAGVDRLLATDAPMSEATLSTHIGRWVDALGASPGE